MNMKSTANCFEKLKMKTLSACDRPSVKLNDFEGTNKCCKFLTVEFGIKLIALYSVLSTIGLL